MQKIWLVIQREYLTRVRKKSFLIMTLVAPLLMVLFYGVIIYFTLNRDIGETDKTIYVYDPHQLVQNQLTDKPSLRFVFGDSMPTATEQKAFLETNQYYAILALPSESANLEGAQFIAAEQPGISTVSDIETQLEQVLSHAKLKKLGIDRSVIDEIQSTQVKLKTSKATESGAENSSAEANTLIGFVGALFIYFFIFLYGVQVMRGVIEEKTNRIVEVIISSLRPFELMSGKIIGLALVGLTQFLIWVVLLTVLGGGVSAWYASNMDTSITTVSSAETSNITSALAGFNFGYFALVFAFYFISGYLFYGALFAAIGSAVDNETDTQQFMLPVTMPLVFAIVLAQSVVVSHPHSTLSVWLSCIPFTSPVVMMVRLPFGVPLSELIVSMICMVAGFMGTVWLAGRIYRIGILLYGKKPTYAEIGKWLFRKD